MKSKWIKMYLDIADRVAQESHAVRLKVGAVFVSPKGVMSTGINGLPAGGSNCCERKVIDEHGQCRLVTLDEVSHAEENLFAKLMQQGVSTDGGWMFLTHEPCINCAKIILNAGIKVVIFRRRYAGSSKTGTEWLSANMVKCELEDNILE
jgi:dCMP deaminase